MLSDHITRDPAILCGKPVVRGTRLGVEFLRELLESGWTMDAVLENYPTLTREALDAVIASSPKKEKR